MIRSSGALQALPAAQLQFDISGVPRSVRHDDSYFSREGGDAESRHVFLDGSRLPERLASESRPRPESKAPARRRCRQRMRRRAGEEGAGDNEAC